METLEARLIPACVGWIKRQESGKPVMNAPHACIATFNLPLGADARFHGTVSSSDGVSASAPVGGVKVTARSDLNGNNAVDPGESVTTQTDAEGQFEQRYPVAEGRAVTVDFDLDDCLELGDIALDASREVTVSLCAITGKVVYSGTSTGSDPGLAPGAPIVGATVYAYDASTDLYADCLVNGLCAFWAATDESGGFSLKIPVLLSAELIAYQFNANPANPSDFRFFVGNQSTEGCPSAPITIKADAYSFPQ